MSNTDIRMKMASMKEEYEAIKNKINNYLGQLDMLDKEYIKVITDKIMRKLAEICNGG